MNDRTATGMRTREQWRVSELRYRRKTAMQQPLLQPPLIDDHQEVIEYLREAVEREFEAIATVGDGNALVAAAALAPGCHRPPNCYAWSLTGWRLRLIFTE